MDGNSAKVESEACWCFSPLCLLLEILSFHAVGALTAQQNWQGADADARRGHPHDLIGGAINLALA
jgi:hypothetical protein